MIADSLPLVQSQPTLADASYVVGIALGLVLGAIALFLYLSLRVWANTKFWGSFGRRRERGAYTYGPDGKLVWDPNAKRQHR